MAVPSDQQILDALRTAMFEIATNGAASYSVNNRTFSALNMRDLEAAITTYTQRVNRASQGMFAVGRFNKPR